MVIFFGCEDGGSKFLGNGGTHPQVHMALELTRPRSTSFSQRENLVFHKRIISTSELGFYIFYVSEYYYQTRNVFSCFKTVLKLLIYTFFQRLVHSATTPTLVQCMKSKRIFKGVSADRLVIVHRDCEVFRFVFG